MAEQDQNEVEDSKSELDEELVSQDDAVEPAAEAADTSDSPELTVELLQEQLATAKEQVLRAAADTQNARRRAEKDVESARKFALERFVSDLLPVVDNLERTLGAANSSDDADSSDGEEAADGKAIAEGVELTLKSLIDTLGRANVVQIDPIGEPFDPNVHQAMAMVENADVEPNSVLQVMQKGYTLSGRLLRPAMVMVSKAPAVDDAPAEET